MDDHGFKFSLGARVARAGLAETLVLEMGHQNDNVPRMDSMNVIERITVECVGGTQRFYHCEMWNGQMGKFAEGSLIPYADAFQQWLDAFAAQTLRVAAAKLLEKSSPL